MWNLQLRYSSETGDFPFEGLDWRATLTSEVSGLKWLQFMSNFKIYKAPDSGVGRQTYKQAFSL